MICPKCGSESVNVVPVTETKSKTRWGCGCLVTWLAFLLPKYVSKTHTEAVCQNCGKRWRVKASDARRSAHMSAIPKGQNNNPATDSTAPFNSFINKLHSAELPFYKQTWFLIVCGLIFPPVGIALVWLIYKDWDIKKKAVISGVMAIWFVLALVFGDNESAAVVSDSDISDGVTISSTDAKLSVVIKGGETGQYGEWLTLGEGETADTFVAYKIPAGNYKATNLDPNYPLWIYVYSEETETLDGWEYQKECLSVIELTAGESKSFSIPNGYYIQLSGSDSATSVLLEQQ